jgi:phosphonate transport system substrate-binding protein
MSEPTTPPSAPVPAASKPPRKNTWIYTLTLSVLLIAGSAGYYFYVKSQNPEPPPIDELKGLKEYLVRLSGNQKLADGYVDVDPKDMVADTPKDAKKLLEVKEELTFSVINTPDPDIAEDPEKVKKAIDEWRSLMEALEKSTGKKVKYQENTETLPGQLQALREGKLHVTAFNTGSVPTAVNTAGFVPLYAPADKDGKTDIHMVVLVRTEAPAKELKDLRGKKVGFVALSSNSGAKAPLVAFKEAGLLPSRDYTYGITGSHKLSIKDLLAGKFDAVCVADDVLAAEEAAGKADKSKYRTIYTSAPFPPICFGVAHNLPPELQTKVKDAFEKFQFAKTTLEPRYGTAGKIKFAPISYEKNWAYVREIDDKLSHLLDGQ